MAYLPASQWKRQQQAQAPVAAPESSGPGGGAPTSAAPSSAPTTPSVDTGSGWTNLQDYLSANQAPLAAEAQHVSQEVTPKAQQAIAPQDIKSTGPMVPWLSDSGGRVYENPGMSGLETSAPLWTDEQRQQAKDLQFEFKNNQNRPGLDQWLRNSSGVTQAWNDAYGKYGDALNTVAGYRWSQPTGTPTPREPVNPPGTPDPTTGDVPPPIGGPWAGLPSATNPDQQGGYNTGVDVGSGPASQGAPGGMFNFGDYGAPSQPATNAGEDKRKARNTPTPTPGAPPQDWDQRPQVTPSTLGEGPQQRRNLRNWLGGR